MNEEEIIKTLEECNESQDITGNCYISAKVIQSLLDLYQKEKEKKKELEDKIEDLIKEYDKECNNCRFKNLLCVDEEPLAKEAQYCIPLAIKRKLKNLIERNSKYGRE